MRKVLLVDDEIDLAEAIEASLSLAGYEVTVTYDGTEALKILATKAFDLVITDLRMPRLDGFSVLRWIMSHKPGTKVVVMTAFGSPTVTDTARRLGALHCLSKPVSRERLLEAVASVLGESGFSVTMQDITVADYVQLCLYTGKTSIFEVSSGKKRGTIGVVEGTVAYAEQGDLKGDQAFLEIISWEGGQINEKKVGAPLTPNIHTGGQVLLLEALRLRDEAGRARQAEAERPGGESPILPEVARVGERPRGLNPPQGTGRGAGTDRHPVAEASLKAAEAPPALDGLSERLNRDAQVTEYGVFVGQDFLRHKRSATRAILSAAPSLYLRLGDRLKEELRCGGLRYVLIHTAGGARYMVFEYLNARGMVGLRPGARPEDLLENLRRR